MQHAVAPSRAISRASLPYPLPHPSCDSAEQPPGFLGRADIPWHVDGLRMLAAHWMAMGTDSTGTQLGGPGRADLQRGRVDMPSVLSPAQLSSRHGVPSSMPSSSGKRPPGPRCPGGQPRQPAEQLSPEQMRDTGSGHGAAVALMATKDSRMGDSNVPMGPDVGMGPVAHEHWVQTDRDPSSLNSLQVSPGLWLHDPWALLVAQARRGGPGGVRPPGWEGDRGAAGGRLHTPGGVPRWVRWVVVPWLV